MYEFSFTMDWLCDEELEAFDEHDAATTHFRLVADFAADEENVEKECGTLTGRLFDCTKIDGDFWSFFDEDDPSDADYVELFGRDNGYSSEVEEIIGLDVSPGKIILFHELVVKRGHRGRGLGLKMLKDAIEIFEKKVDFFALKPFPLQYRGKKNPDYLKEDFKAQDKESAEKKLVSLYESVGFVHTGLETPIMIRS